MNPLHTSKSRHRAGEDRRRKEDMTPKHKAVAFERGTHGYDGGQQGYAARCDTCGAVTFGGFSTKASAKAALFHAAVVKPND